MLISVDQNYKQCSTDINKSYFDDLEKTITVIDSALALPEDWEFEYQSSW